MSWIPEKYRPRPEPDFPPGATFWNGQPTPAVRGTAIVGESPFPQFWGRDLIGQRIAVVRVDYADDTFYLDNRDGSGWWKVTEGHGSPRWGHRNLTAIDFRIEVQP